MAGIRHLALQEFPKDPIFSTHHSFMIPGCRLDPRHHLGHRGQQCFRVHVRLRKCCCVLPFWGPKHASAIVLPWTWCVGVEVLRCVWVMCCPMLTPWMLCNSQISSCSCSSWDSKSSQIGWSTSIWDKIGLPSDDKRCVIYIKGHSIHSSIMPVWTFLGCRMLFGTWNFPKGLQED